MKFHDRFRGKLSTMKKDGIMGILADSKNPIDKNPPPLSPTLSPTKTSKLMAKDSTGLKSLGNPYFPMPRLNSISNEETVSTLSNPGSKLSLQYPPLYQRPNLGNSPSPVNQVKQQTGSSNGQQLRMLSPPPRRANISPLPPKSNKVGSPKFILPGAQLSDVSGAIMMNNANSPKNQGLISMSNEDAFYAARQRNNTQQYETSKTSLPYLSNVEASGHNMMGNRQKSDLPSPINGHLDGRNGGHSYLKDHNNTDSAFPKSNYTPLGAHRRDMLGSHRQEAFHQGSFVELTPTKPNPRHASPQQVGNILEILRNPHSGPRAYLTPPLVMNGSLNNSYRLQHPDEVQHQNNLHMIQSQNKLLQVPQNGRQFQYHFETEGSILTGMSQDLSSLPVNMSDGMRNNEHKVSTLKTPSRSPNHNFHYNPTHNQGAQQRQEQLLSPVRLRKIPKQRPNADERTVVGTYNY